MISKKLNEYSMCQRIHSKIRLKLLKLTLCPLWSDKNQGKGRKFKSKCKQWSEIKLSITLLAHFMRGHKRVIFSKITASIFTLCKRYVSKSGSGNLKDTFWRVTRNTNSENSKLSSTGLAIQWLHSEFIVSYMKLFY